MTKHFNDVILSGANSIEPAIDPIYLTDNYPRVGISLSVHLTKTGWSLNVFAPGFDPVMPHGFIESYCGRHGSLGLILDAYVAGKDLRSIRKQKLKSEEDYSRSFGSIVTSKSSLNSRLTIFGVLSSALYRRFLKR